MGAATPRRGVDRKLSCLARYSGGGRRRTSSVILLRSLARVFAHEHEAGVRDPSVFCVGSFLSLRPTRW